MSDKQKPEKIIKKSYFYGEEVYCPSCGKHIGYDYSESISFCYHCGQALEWYE